VQATKRTFEAIYPILKVPIIFKRLAVSEVEEPQNCSSFSQQLQRWIFKEWLVVHSDSSPPSAAAGVSSAAAASSSSSSSLGLLSAHSFSLWIANSRDLYTHFILNRTYVVVPPSVVTNAGVPPELVNAPSA
jgi:hypothetical protein